MRVLCICTLMLLLSLAGAWEMLSDLISGRRMSFNIAVLFLPVSLGLFMGVRIARTAATLLFCVIYALLAGALLMSLWSPREALLRLSGMELPLQAGFPLIFVAVAMLGSVSALIHWMLYSEAFEEHLA